MISGYGTNSCTDSTNADSVKSMNKACTIIIGAEKFLGTMPEGFIMEGDRSLKDYWVHNNVAIGMAYPEIKTKDFLNIRKMREGNVIVSEHVEDAEIKINIPEDGLYNLFVRSHGTDESGFKVIINGRADPNDYGNRPMSWKKGSCFELKKGVTQVRLHLTRPKPVFDMLVLTKDNEFDLQDCERIPRRMLPEEVELLKEFKIHEGIGTTKYGILKDGKIGFAGFDRDYSTYVYDHEGNHLWTYKAPPVTEMLEGRAGFEPPAVIWDIDGDGNGEVIHWRYIDGEQWLVVADGATGEIKNKTLFPCTEPHAFNNYRIAVAKLKPGYPDDLIVYADCGGTIFINAYDKALNLLWSHVEKRKKDNLGHYIYPRDINGDGIDEVIVGALALDSHGKVLWDRLEKINHDHIDSMRFIDIDNDGAEEIIAAYSNLGACALRLDTGEKIWSAEAWHNQQIEAGDFLDGISGPHIAAGARIYSPGRCYIYGQIYWIDSKGSLIKIWPKTSLNGNPDFAKGDWEGNGRETLFWFRFKMDRNGEGIYCFPEDVYHMFDYFGEGAENIITREKGVLRIYGCRYAKRDVKNAKRDIEYLRRKVVNHTHY